MTGICFYFQPEDVDVWSGKDLDAWHYASVVGGVDTMLVINETDQELKNPDSAREFLVVQSLAQAKEVLSGHITQLVCPWNTPDTVEVWDYDHDTSWYVFGPANGWGDDIFGDATVTIPVPDRLAFHAVHAATVVMASRFGKLGT